MTDAAINYWPLLGVLAVVLGFLLRLNTALVVVVAAWVALSSGLWEQLLFGSGLLN